ncbi:MAG: hypothetical protein N3A01_08325 [Bacteroidales bacterium]|nr:hypothetical protein [Bacteroidales bacterium]
MKVIKFTFLLLIVFNTINSQICISPNPDGEDPDVSAALHIKYTNKGLLIPQVALTGTNDATTIATPAKGLLVYNTGTGGLTPAGFYYNAGTPTSPNWVRFLESKQAWMIDGNDNTDPATHFLGTTNDKDLQFKTNNINRMRIMSSAYSSYPTIGIGTIFPVINLDGSSAVLHVHDGGNSVGSQLILSTHSTTPGARAGGLYFAATQATNNRITANIQSYLTAYSGGNASGDLRFFTNNNNTVAERMRITPAGNIGINTTTPTSEFLVTITPNTNAIRSGIDMTLTNATSTAYGINITTSNANVNGILMTHGSSSTSSSFYAIGGVLSSTRIVSGYLGYRTGSGNSYGLYGITGTTSSYNSGDANTWAAFIQGRAVISSESAPTSPLGVDLEIRNTTAGSGNPVTLSMRQTTSETISGRTLAHINFGDNHTTSPQAQISILREAAGGSNDYPTAIIFSNTQDGASSLLERMRISNNGNVGINTTTPAHRLHVVNTTNSISAVYADNSSISSSGTSWSYGSSNVSAIQGISSTGANYTAGVFGYRFSVGSNGAGVIGAWSSTIWGGLGCEEGSNRWGVFTPANAAIRGYLVVGNPSVPQSISSGATLPIYQWNNQNGLFGWYTSGGCGSGNWSYIIDGLNSYICFDNVGSRSYQPLLSPWMWIPSNSTIRVGLSFNSSLEHGYDGVYLEYTTDNVNWIKVTNWIYGDYNTNVTGSNSTCSSSNPQPAWSNTGAYGPLSDNISITNGTWIRFRLVGVEDVAISSGEFRFFGFSVWIYNPTFGGSFSAGNIYAEKNVYAGSNVLLGDLAEHFNVEGNPKKGMLIAVNPHRSNSYIISKNAYSDQVIGIYSESPTLTLNNPNSGIPVALAGRVPVLVTAKNGAIKVGDYLTASDIPGVAMKADKPCFVVGMALEPYENTNKEGKILCLVQPGWYNCNNTTLASGEFFVPDNYDEVVVYDDRISKNSKLFITMLDDPQGRFWIKEKDNGRFILKFSQKVKGNVKFDYLIENVKNNISPGKTLNNFYSYTKPIDFEEGGWKYDETKKIYWKEEPEKEGIKKIEVPIEVESNIPPIPEDTENPHIYFPDKQVMKTIFLKTNSESIEKEILEKQNEIKK